jgi:hypothetical protein
VVCVGVTCHRTDMNDAKGRKGNQRLGG